MIVAVADVNPSCTAAAVDRADQALAVVRTKTPFNTALAGGARRLIGAFARADAGAPLRPALIACQADACATPDTALVQAASAG